MALVAVFFYGFNVFCETCLLTCVIVIGGCRETVETFENDHAARVNEVSASGRGTGKGGGKRWLPQAMLRAARLVSACLDFLSDFQARSFWPQVWTFRCVRHQIAFAGEVTMYFQLE